MQNNYGFELLSVDDEIQKLKDETKARRRAGAIKAAATRKANKAKAKAALLLGTKQ